MKTKILYNKFASIIVVSIIFLLSCASLTVSRETSKEHPQGVVVHCFDGDTVKLNDRRIVRLAGIDAPEVSHKDKKAQYYSRQAKKILSDLALGQQVYLEIPGINANDKYGRILADLKLADGISINESLVEQGAAFFYPHMDLNPYFQERLLELQREAIKERRGLWSKLLSLPLATETYVGNRQTLRFFPANCPAVQQIKPRNREHFGTLMDAFLAGYAPARYCIFWPEDGETE